MIKRLALIVALLVPALAAQATDDPALRELSRRGEVLITEYRPEAGPVTAAAAADPRPGTWGMFAQSFLILGHQGVESVLVLAALAVYLRRSGQADRLRAVRAGALWAGLASLASAWVLVAAADTAVGVRPVLHGAVLLIGACVLYHVGFWPLFHRGEVSSDDRADSGRWPVALAAFLAVYRQGAETVLYYQALAVASPGLLSPLAAGIAAAAAALVTLFLAMRQLFLNLPLNGLFITVAALLFLQSLTLAGTGMIELQQGRVVSITPIAFVPRIEWLGLFPTAESLAAQLVLLIPLVAALGWYLLRRDVA